MTVVVQHLTNGAFGFPTRGAARRVKPVALACIHITGNSQTAAYADLHAAAQAEWRYANRAGSGGPSATHYIARDGWAIEAIDWRQYAAWSNGDVASPNTANPGVARVLAMRAKGYNANEAYWLELEDVGYGSTYPITAAQVDAIAALIVEASKLSGLPISRETVHGHWEINGVDRRNCPAPYAQRETFLAQVITRAQALAAPTGDPVSTITLTLLPNGGGTATIPAGKVVQGFTLVNGKVVLGPKFGPSPSPSTAHFDAGMSTDITRGEPFIRIVDGPLAGQFVGSTGLILVPNQDQALKTAAREAARAVAAAAADEAKKYGA